jgi:hypothetical protein
MKALVLALLLAATCLPALSQQPAALIDGVQLTAWR